MRPRAILLGILTITLLCSACKKKKNRSACWSGKAIPTIPPYKPSKKAITVKSLHPSWAPATNSSQNCAVAALRITTSSLLPATSPPPLRAPASPRPSTFRSCRPTGSSPQDFGISLLSNPTARSTASLSCGDRIRSSMTPLSLRNPRIPGRFLGPEIQRQNLRVG